MSLHVVGRQQEDDRGEASENAQNSTEEDAVLREVTNGMNNQANSQSLHGVLQMIVNSMIDDQTAVMAYKTIYKAKTMKQMRKKRDHVINEVVRQTCREIAEAEMKQLAEQQNWETAAGPSPQEETIRKGETPEAEKQEQEDKRNSRPSRTTDQSLTNQKLCEGDSSIIIPYQPSDIIDSNTQTPSMENEQSKLELKFKTSEFKSKEDEEEPTVISQNGEFASQDLKNKRSAIYTEENPDLSVDPLSSPSNVLNTAEQAEELPEPAEVANQAAGSESKGHSSSPQVSNFGDSIANHRLNLSKRSMDIHIYTQQTAKTTRNEPQSAAQHSQRDLGKMLQRQSPRQDLSTDNKRQAGHSYMEKRRTSGGHLHSPKMANVGPRVPSALGVAESKTKPRMVPPNGLTLKHARNQSKQDHMSDVRSQGSSNQNFSMNHKSPTSKRRTLAVGQTSATMKLTNSGSLQKESIVPHINLKFQRNMKKMSSESRIESNKPRKHKFNPDGKKDGDTPTFINENSITSASKPKKTSKAATKNSRTMYGLNQSSGLQKSVEVRPTSASRGNVGPPRNQKKHSYFVRTHALEKETKTATQDTQSALPLTDNDGLNRSTDNIFEQAKPQFASKPALSKHHKNPSFQPNASATSVHIGQSQSAAKERKLSQSGQYATNNKAMSQTKSLKSSILFKTPQQRDIGKVTNKYVKPRPDRLEHEVEAQSNTQARDWKKSTASNEPKTPTKRREVPSGHRRQLQGGLSPLVGRPSKPSPHGAQRSNHLPHAGADHAASGGGLVFQRKQSHQLLGHLSLKERRMQQQMMQSQEENRQKQLEQRQREKRQWDRALDKVAREMLDHVLGNIAEPAPVDQEEEPEGALTTVVIESIQQVEDEQREQILRHERAAWGQAMKMVQKKMVRSVTQRCVTEIIQESTDAIYKFEDDAISLADWVLRSLLQKEIRNEIFEAVKATAVRKQPIQFIEEDDFSIIQPQEALGSDRDGALDIPQERTYNPNQYAMNLFDSQTNSSKFEELAVGTPTKHSQGDRILYDQMMEDFSINEGKHYKRGDGQPSQMSHVTQQSIQSSFINGSGAKPVNRTAANAMDFDESRHHQSNIMRESSRGLDKIRKSVIQQQSERYLMRRGRKSNSRGSLPNLAGSSFQTTRNADVESQRQPEDGKQDSQGNKPRDDEGVIVVKKVAKTSQLQTMSRKIQNPNDSLRFIRNPSKYSSTLEGNEVVPRQNKRRSNQTPMQDHPLDGGYRGIDRSYANTQMNASHHMETPTEELEATDSHASGPYFGRSMLSAQKTPKGHLEPSKPFKTHHFDGQKVGPTQNPKSTMAHPMIANAQNRMWTQQPFEEAAVTKKPSASYVGHEIQRYSRNIDADEEGITQEAHSSRLPSQVLTQNYSEVPRSQPGEKHMAGDHHNRYLRYRERQLQEKRLVQMPKSRVTTMNVGERDHQLTSQKKVKHATIAIASLIGSDGESTGNNGGPASRMSNRSYQNMVESQLSSMPPTQPTNSTMLSPGLGVSRSGNSPGIGPSLSAKQNGATGLSPFKNSKRTKKMIVNHQIVQPKSLRPNPNENYYQWKNQAIHQQSGDASHKVQGQPLPLKPAEEEPRIHPTKGMNIKPIFQYGQQNFTHAGAKHPARPPPHQHPMGSRGAGQMHYEQQRATPEKAASLRHEQTDANAISNRQYSSSGRSSQDNSNLLGKSASDRVPRGVVVSHHQTQRKPAPKGRVQMGLLEDPKRMAIKNEGGTSRVQPRKGGFAYSRPTNQMRQQQELQMKQLEQLEKELRDDEMQFEAFSGDDMHESVICSDQEFSINPSAYEEIHNEAQHSEGHQRAQEQNMVRRR